MIERLTARSPKNNMAYLVNIKDDEQSLEGSYNTLVCVKDSFELLARYEDTGLTPKQIQALLAEKETTLNGTYISMEAHNREVKKLKAEIGYEQDRIDCRNTICNANREGMYRKCAELESQIEALTADKDEQAGKIVRMEILLKRATGVLKYCRISACEPAQAVAKSCIRAIDDLLGGKEDV